MQKKGIDIQESEAENMYCGQCGARVDGGAFCGQCGSANNNRNDSPPHPEHSVQSPKKIKSGKWPLLGIPLVAIAGVLIALFSLNIIGGSASQYEPLIIGEWIHTEEAGFIILDFSEDGYLTTIEYVSTGTESDWLPLEERISLAEEAKEISTWETCRNDSLNLTEDEDDSLEFATQPNRVRSGQWYIGDDILIIQGQRFIRNEEADLSTHEILGTWREIEVIFGDEEPFVIDLDEEIITYTFNADGTYILFMDSPFFDDGTIRGNFTIWANQLTFYNRSSEELPDTREEAISNFRIDGNRLIITYHPHEDGSDVPFISITVRD